MRRTGARGDEDDEPSIWSYGGKSIEGCVGGELSHVTAIRVYDKNVCGPGAGNGIQNSSVRHKRQTASTFICSRGNLDCAFSFGRLSKPHTGAQLALDRRYRSAGIRDTDAVIVV